MYKNFKIVKVDSKYCNYLRKYDDKVSYNAGLKELRPFVGVLFNVNNKEYFAPLSSPKNKHKFLKNTIDLIKIEDGKYGVINFNNMIPVKSNNYQEFNLNKETKNKEEIYTKSSLLYRLYVSNKLPENVRNRCCNFPLLEMKCEIYNK